MLDHINLQIKVLRHITSLDFKNVIACGSVIPTAQLNNATSARIFQETEVPQLPLDSLIHFSYFNPVCQTSNCATHPVPLGKAARKTAGQQAKCPFASTLFSDFLPGHICALS